MPIYREFMIFRFAANCKVIIVYSIASMNVLRYKIRIELWVWDYLFLRCWGSARELWKETFWELVWNKNIHRYKDVTQISSFFLPISVRCILRAQNVSSMHVMHVYDKAKLKFDIRSFSSTNNMHSKYKMFC